MPSKQYGYTEPGADFPQYVNIQPAPDGIKMRLIVRGAKTADGRCGETVAMDFPRTEWAKLREAMLDVALPEDAKPEAA